jgi:hypothetical protein
MSKLQRVVSLIAGGLGAAACGVLAAYVNVWHGDALLSPESRMWAVLISANTAAMMLLILGSHGYSRAVDRERLAQRDEKGRAALFAEVQKMAADRLASDERIEAARVARDERIEAARIERERETAAGIARHLDRFRMSVEELASDHRDQAVLVRELGARFMGLAEVVGQVVDRVPALAALVDDVREIRRDLDELDADLAATEPTTATSMAAFRALKDLEPHRPT